MEAVHHIDGEWIAGGHQWATSLDPATGEAVGRLALGGVDEAEAAIKAARTAFARPFWSQNPRLRQSVLLEWAARLERGIAPLAELLTRENGKTLAQARGEIERSAATIRFYAGLARMPGGNAAEIAPGEFVTILREPIGVAGLIIPWNAPVNLLARALAPALAAGCATVIKPAPQTSLVTAAALRTLTDIEALPKGVVNLVLETGHAMARHLVTSEHVDMISFTGSTATGQAIVADSAPTLKKLSLELGGKSCCIVFEDVEIDAIAPHLVTAALAISGQQCVAARRILVHAGKAKEMTAALKDRLANVVVAPGLAAGTQMGPLIDAKAHETVAGRIAEAESQTDAVILNACRPEGAGSFLTPSLIAHSDSRAFFCQEEIFGPLIVVETFESEAEAVALANHTTFGLSASVWTHDGARALRVARALSDGVVWINDHGKLNAEAEAGGYRRSGLGRVHGAEGLHEFQEIKQIYQSVGTVDAPRE